MEIAYMATEDVDPRFADLDAWSLASAMEAMWEGQLAAVAAIGRALPAITAATNSARDALGDRGRLIYVGAGTSGRVAVQDGAELMPTFAWPKERLCFIIAGGESAFVTSIEGAEDDTDDAVNQITQARLSPRDVVIAVSASGTTPFTVAALQQAGASRRGHDRHRQQSRRCAAHIGKVSGIDRDRARADRRINADEGGHGPKGRTQFDLLGHYAAPRQSYRGMMVNMQATNAKLKRRAEAMVAQIARCNQEQAAAPSIRRRGHQDSGASGVGLRQDESRDYSRRM